MTDKKIDWHLMVAIISVLITFVVAIPTVYSFEKQRFFWQVDSGQKEVTKSTEYIEW
jgi:hypothetical protein